MSNAINRRSAINALCDNCDNVQAVCPHYPCKQYTAIEALPPTPERKMGKWIDDGDPLTLVCSECSYQVARYNNTPYCPHCGAKMEEVQDGN